MYQPPHFIETRTEVLHALMHQRVKHFGAGFDEMRRLVHGDTS